MKLTSTYARFNMVAGNYIGTDVTGLVARGNTYGVSVASGATNNTLDAFFDTANSGQVKFTAITTDPGVADTPDLRYEWSVNNGGFSSPSTLNAFTAGLSGLTQLSVRVTDGDGGIRVRSYFVLQGTPNDDTFTITGSNTTGAGADDQILYLALDGNDNITIDGSVTIASGGTQSIVSGGDGDDQIDASNRGDDLYGDDGDDVYRILITSAAVQRIRLRELLYVDPADFEPQARGSDTIDLSAFSTSANLNLGTLGVFNDLNVGVQSVIGTQLQLILSLDLAVTIRSRVVLAMMRLTAAAVTIYSCSQRTPMCRLERIQSTKPTMVALMDWISVACRLA